MKNTINKTICKGKIVLIINENKIDDNLTNKILEFTKKSKKIGLNMKNVKSISSEKFIISLLKNKFKLFNLNSEVLLYLFLIIKKGSLKSFICEKDFIDNKRELIKRSFLVA